MTKTVIAMSIELDELELLSDIKRRYHQKNLSQAMNTIIKQWQMMTESRIQEVKTGAAPPGPPTSNAILKEKIKNDPMLDPKWTFLHAKPEDPNLKSKVKYKKPSNPMVDL